ncbi:hypothetical protein G9H22_20295, partial [Escherichia coli]|nr:hypothetical protein [Escherichia coli]
MESLSEGTTAGYQQIHDGIIHLVDSARTETVRSVGNDSNLLIVFYVQIMPDDFVMQLHR